MVPFTPFFPSALRLFDSAIKRKVPAMKGKQSQAQAILHGRENLHCHECGRDSREQQCQNLLWCLGMAVDPVLHAISSHAHILKCYP